MKVSLLPGKYSLKHAGIVFGLMLMLVGGMVFSLPSAAIAAPLSAGPEVIQVSQAPTFPPALGDRLRQDLSKRVGVPASRLQIVETTTRTWANGCLGLAQPDEMCSQAMVPGWRVVITDGSRQWVYRTDRSGRTFRLEPASK
jgi:outer membrane lipoprotein-sorting protein